MRPRHPFAPPATATPARRLGGLRGVTGGIALTALASLLTADAAADAAATTTSNAPPESTWSAIWSAVDASTAVAVAVGFEPEAARALESARSHLSTGHRQLARAETIDAAAARLRALDRAAASLRRGLRVAAAYDASPIVATRDAIAEDLARALGLQAEIYYARGSLPQARDRAAEALSVLPGDSRYRALADRIADAMARDALLLRRPEETLEQRRNRFRNPPKTSDPEPRPAPEVVPEGSR